MEKFTVERAIEAMEYIERIREWRDCNIEPEGQVTQKGLDEIVANATEACDVIKEIISHALDIDSTVVR